jgi:ribosomal protein S18 acetylase RimI-like enzyme
MIVADWRTMSVPRMAALFEIERQRWQNRLHWDYAGTLADIERARVSGRLPGFVAFDGGVVRGWSYHLLHRRTLQIGGVIADSAAVTARLVGAALGSDEGRSARSTLAFGYFDAPAIESVLRDRGHAVERYHYLARPLHDMESVDQPFEPYPYEDAGGVAGLLQRAYEGVAAMRPFARSGRFDEWFEYLTQLTLTNACGAFDPHASQIARDSGELKGVALVTRIATLTAHLAQIVVDPRKQGEGLATRLVHAACASARRQGCVRISLMVGDSNHGARALYQARGFVASEHFLLACN